MIDIVVLCASHLDSPKRILFLKAQIKSIMEQTHKVPMYISISGYNFNDNEFKNNQLLHIYYHDVKKSQFEHYIFLSKYIPDNTFCIFCDDDDYSHRERCKFYADSEDKGQNSLFVPDALLLINTNEIVNGQEYFMYATRSKILKTFCNILLKYNCLKSPVCDLLFGSILACTLKLVRSAYPNSWLYAYNNQDKDRENEIFEYEKLLLNKPLINEIKTTFNIQILYPTTVYGDDAIFEPI